MKKSNYCLFLFALLLVTGIRAQSPQQTYSLGVSMGFASFQSSVAMGDKTNESRMIAARNLAVQSLEEASRFASGINTMAGWDLLDLKLLQDVRIDATFKCSGDRKACIDNYNNTMNPKFYNAIVGLRDNYSAQLNRAHKTPLVHAYTLGVNMAIAEGQATAGEAARQVVQLCLMNAKTAAQSLIDLNGLHTDLNALNECILLASGSTPLNDLYTRIVSVRSTFMTSL